MPTLTMRAELILFLTRPSLWRTVCVSPSPASVSAGPLPPVDRYLGLFWGRCLRCCKSLEIPVLEPPHSLQLWACLLLSRGSRAAAAPLKLGRQEPRGGHGGNFSSRVGLILEDAFVWARAPGLAYRTRVKRPGQFDASGFPAEH